MSTAALAALLVLALALPACGRKSPPVVGAGIAGIRASISKILFSPLAHDGAQLAVEGIALGVAVTDSHDDGPVTTFKLSDLRGSYINVRIIGRPEIEDHNYVVVGGMYRRKTNEIEAGQYEVIRTQEEIDAILEGKKR